MALFRRIEPTEPVIGMYEQSICLVAQGTKRVLLGYDTYLYDSHQQTAYLCHHHYATLQQLTVYG